MAKKTIEKPTAEFKVLSNSALSMVGLYEEDDKLFNVIAQNTTFKRGYVKAFGNILFTDTTEQELRDLLKAGKIKRV